ncbi:RNA polymerase factor sigma-54 [Echinimonas agarilytica]|uniref:RNA polymerase sigma-54 factor n=1 Tax=Echinimonas agarilytica TaxID=1215918 RepID=A0AA42B6L5_9GAMM|nr:RNA polymerase factor sigma-54 [Echinimonas agarilytica]MCM2678611.1 RNA polymerase factor sigma-54 [Echinimonas agarilytica]
MKPSLQLKFGQQLTMTPQLQQAIRLLQLSTLDLQQEIQEALDSNPLLEQSEEENSSSADSDVSLDSIEADSSTVDTAEALQQDSISEEMPMDTTWDEVVSAAPVASAAPMREDDESFQGETTDSLHAHLEWQLELTPMTDTDRAIARTILDGIDDAGYLTVTTEDILESQGNAEVELDEIEAVLKRIQLFDPIGSGSRSIKECLLIQLRQFGTDTPWLKEAMLVINNHMDLLASRDYRTLMRRARLKEDQLREVMRLIQSLNPRPGSAIVVEDSQYVIPDVSVMKRNGVWQVELNPDAVPKIRVNEQYAAMSRGARNTSDGQFIRSHMQEAKWFIKSLESRNETLMKVSNCILKRQYDFFEYGDEAMKPMVLNDVAEEVGMHESTISRVTTQKYMHTPRGIFELKYFFSSHVSTESGGECSSTAIRALIKKLVAAENPAKPLSDSKMAELLSDQGINVARRTIAKYREALNIPPSNQRKSLL